MVKKNSSNLKGGKERLKKGERAAKYAILTNLFLSVIKGIFGLLSGSVALIADSIHSFSDIFASLAVYIGLKLSQRKPDQRFPYGYYKAETMSSLIIAVVIVIGGLEIIMESFQGIIDPQPLKMPFIAIIVAAIAVIVSFLLSRYEKQIGDEIGSPALLGDSKHSLIDVFSSALVFASILASYIGYLSLQGVAGVVVSLLIIWMGLKIGKNAILVLLDATLDPETVGKIKELALSVNGVEGVHEVKVRSSGPYIFAELHLETKKEMSVEKAHEISTEVEKMVKKEVKKLETLMVHVEPVKKDKIRFAIAVENNNGLKSIPSKHFGKIPYFFIWDVSKGEIETYQIKNNPAYEIEKKRGIKTAEFLARENVDIILTKEMGEGPKYVLSESFIRFLPPKGDNLEEIMKNSIDLKVQ
ncbi:MAG: cation diffusion facilitator family transporter [Methanobacteriaceae archaeon]|nr:cation diffusion facilitator family transporter [Methanobacteriaceae archaeon]